MNGDFDKNLMLVSVFGVVAILTIVFAFSPTSTGYAVTYDNSIYEDAGYRDIETVRSIQEPEKSILGAVDYRKRDKGLRTYDSSLAGETDYHTELVSECLEINSDLLNADLYCECRAKDNSYCSDYLSGEWDRGMYYSCLERGYDFQYCQQYLEMVA